MCIYIYIYIYRKIDRYARSSSSCLPARMQMSSTYGTKGVVALEFELDCINYMNMYLYS